MWPCFKTCRFSTSDTQLYLVAHLWWRNSITWKAEYHGHMAAGGQVKVRGGYWEDLRNPSEAVALIQYASDTACRDAIRTNIRDLDGESRHLLLSKHERGRRFETKELHWW